MSLMRAISSRVYYLTSTDLIFSWWARVKIDHKTQESEESEESEEERLSWNFGLRPFVALVGLWQKPIQRL